MARAGFGTAKVGNDFKKVGKPGEGNNFIRILPPMGKLASDDKGWAVFHTTIWGFSGKHPTEPGKTVPRPIHSIEVKSKATGITQHDPLVDWINEFAQETEAYKQAWMLKTGEKDEKKARKVLEESDEEFKNRIAWLRRFNIEAKVYINCMYKDGTFGPFKINYGFHKKGIDELYKKYLAAKNPVDMFDLDSGFWVNIRRPGNGVVPPDVVEPEFKEIEVEVAGEKITVQRLVPAPLTEEQSNQALKECPDLSTLGGDTLTYEQMVALRDCSGDPDEVDAIFGYSVSGKKTPLSPLTVANSSPAGAVNLAADVINSRPEIVTETKPETKPEVKGEPKVVEVDPAIAARLATIRAKQALEAEAVAKKVAEEAAPSSEMSDAEFLKRFSQG